MLPHDRTPSRLSATISPSTATFRVISNRFIGSVTPMRDETQTRLHYANKPRFSAIAMEGRYKMFGSVRNAGRSIDVELEVKTRQGICVFSLMGSVIGMSL